MLVIDGSVGEGGGQILRTSLALSLITGTPVRLENIRAKRSKPGLLRQHRTAVEAAIAIGAVVEGGELGSQQVVVDPGATRGGDHVFAVGSAGSACLVLQTVLPPLLAAGEAAQLVFEGGTHNPYAPPYDYIERVFLPVLRRMGANVETRLERRGFYPAGGGRFVVNIAPGGRLRPIDLLDRGNLVARRALAIISSVPYSVAERELSVVAEELGWESAELECISDRTSPGPGNVLFLEVEHEEITEMFVGFGERGVRAEKVARRGVDEVRRYLRGRSPVGVRLADQLMLPFAIAGGGAFRTGRLSDHASTNLQIIERFLPGLTRVEEDGDEVTVTFDAMKCQGTID